MGALEAETDQGYVEVYSNDPFFSNSFVMFVLYRLQMTVTTV